MTYNHGGHIQRCLEALAPTLSAADEVVVIDNASGDNTAELVAQSGVRVERMAANTGFGAGCNYGGRRSSARFLVFLNPDTEPQPGWLDALLGALERTPGAGLATAKLLLTGRPDRIDAYGNDLHISGIPTCHGWGEPAARHPRVEEVAAVSGACFAVSRALFFDLGGFDERLFLYYEDDDLSLRARLAGYACIAVPDARVLHDHTPGFSPDKLRYLERNRWWTLLKVFRWRTLFALIPVMAGAEFLAWGMALLSGPVHLVALARAHLDLVRWITDMPTSRAEVQRYRKVGDRDLLRLHAARLPFAQVARSALARRAEQLASAGFSGGRAIAMRLAVR